MKKIQLFSRNALPVCNLPRVSHLAGRNKHLKTMTIHKSETTGAWVISNLIGSRLVTRTYYGFSKREAVRAFKAESRN